MITRKDMPEALAQSFGLSPCQAAIVAKLWYVGNSWISSRDLNDCTFWASCYADGVQRTDKAIHVHVHAIRAKRGDEFILGHKVYGYTLGAPGILAIKHLLSEAA